MWQKPEYQTQATNKKSWSNLPLLFVLVGELKVDDVVDLIGNGGCAFVVVDIVDDTAVDVVVVVVVVVVIVDVISVVVVVFS